MDKFQLLKKKTEYPLQEVPEPNLLRDIFPYSEVPRIAFDGMSVPMDPPDEIWITDTTFRDGQQARPPYTPEQITKIYDMFHKLGGTNGVIRQCEFFLYTDRDKAAVRMCQELGHKYPEVTGWIRAVKEDFKIVKEMGLKETGILTSSSDYHIFRKMKKSRSQAMADYLDVAKAALDSGVHIRCHFEDITRADIFGFIVPFAIELMKLSDSYKIPIKIRLCDTMGFGLPWPESSLPRSIPKLLYVLMHEAGVPKDRMEWHGHNDFHKVNINGTTAWLYGCAYCNVTLFGFGERTGNPPLEGAVIDYIALKGHNNGMDTTVITDLMRYMRDEVNFQVPHNYPLVGAGFNVTMAGIHADGVTKDEEIYNIFDTAKILNRPLGVTITDKSGSAGIAYWVNNYLGLTGSSRIDKGDKRVTAIYEDVMAEYNAGRTTGMDPAEMLQLARKHIPEHFQAPTAAAAS